MTLDGPRKRFELITSALITEPDVQAGTGFGTNPGLRRRRTVFAMLVDDDLVVKLPAQRCRALLDSGVGAPFQVGSRQMREWVRISDRRADDWDGLAGEAYKYARR